MIKTDSDFSVTAQIKKKQQKQLSKAKESKKYNIVSTRGLYFESFFFPVSERVLP